jgi:hypothetical protein
VSPATVPAGNDPPIACLIQNPPGRWQIIGCNGQIDVDRITKLDTAEKTDRERRSLQEQDGDIRVGKAFPQPHRLSRLAERRRDAATCDPEQPVRHRDIRLLQRVDDQRGDTMTNGDTGNAIPIDMLARERPDVCRLRRRSRPDGAGHHQIELREVRPIDHVSTLR